MKKRRKGKVGESQLSCDEGKKKNEGNQQAWFNKLFQTDLCTVKTGTVPAAHTLIYNEIEWQLVRSVARLHKMPDLQIEHRKNTSLFIKQAYLFINIHSCLLQADINRKKRKKNQIIHMVAKSAGLGAHVKYAATIYLTIKAIKGGGGCLRTALAMTH